LQKPETKLAVTDSTVNWDILVWVKFGAFAPKWGGFILVCSILALWFSGVIIFGAFVCDIIMLRCDTHNQDISGFT